MKKFIRLLKNIYHKILHNHVAKSFFHDHSSLVNDHTYNQLLRECKNAHIDFLYYASEINRIYLKTADGITLTTDKYYYVLVEIFSYKIYSLPPYPALINAPFCVFDVGMNRGYTSLFFANHPCCTNVFGFEIDKDTFSFAQENFALNPGISSKINPFDFGLYNEDKTTDLYYDGIDSRSSIKPSSLAAQNTQSKKTQVRKASNVFKELIQNNNLYSTNKILKIDCEGAEYEIFDELAQAGMLDEFSVVVGELHSGMQQLPELFKNFRLIYSYKTPNNLIHFLYIKENLLP